MTVLPGPDAYASVDPDSGPPLGAIVHNPYVPFDPMVFTYTRFGPSYEPHEYTGWVDESMSWKTTCYIGDWSPLLKLRVAGPAALTFLSGIGVNSTVRFDIGQAKHFILCNEDGKVTGEGILMRRGEEEFVFTSAPGVHWMRYQFSRAPRDATEELLDQYIFQVQGPDALRVMQRVTGDDLTDIGFMRFRETSIAGRPVTVLRQGMAGEIGYELHGPAADARTIYQAVLDAGAEFGIRRLGGRTKMVNHVEACFPTPSVDYTPAWFEPRDSEFVDWVRANAPAALRLFNFSGSLATDDVRARYRSPVELGWARNVKFDHDFIGRAALEREVAEPVRSLVTLVWNNDDVIDAYASLYRAGDPVQPMELPRDLLGRMITDLVLVGDTVVGTSTSRCYSYYFREMLSLATVDVAVAQLGTEVEVLWGDPGPGQRRIRATVASAPYKTDNRRADVTAAV